MKANNRFYLVRGLALLAWVAGAAPLSLMAQSKPAGPNAVSVPQADVPRIDLDLGDGTTLLDAVQNILGRFRKAGQDVNIVLKLHGEEVKIPPLSLQRVTAEQAVQAVVLTANPPVKLQGDAELMVIFADAETAAKSKMRVFNVSAFLGKPNGTAEEHKAYQRKVALLNIALEKGMALGAKLNPELQQAQFEVDQETGLLFATGSAGALEIVAEVLSALCDTPRTSEKP